jgi:hypothetical protein
MKARAYVVLGVALLAGSDRARGAVRDVCDGATSHTLATSEAVGSTFALTSHGQERYITRQLFDLQNWVSSGAHGTALCKYSGLASALDDSLVTAKGSCSGTLRVTLVGPRFCQFQALIGKTLVEGGPCPM